MENRWIHRLERHTTRDRGRDTIMLSRLGSLVEKKKEDTKTTEFLLLKDESDFINWRREKSASQHDGIGCALNVIIKWVFRVTRSTGVRGKAGQIELWKSETAHEWGEHGSDQSDKRVTKATRAEGPNTIIVYCPTISAAQKEYTKPVAAILIQQCNVTFI